MNLRNDGHSMAISTKSRKTLYEEPRMVLKDVGKKTDPESINLVDDAEKEEKSIDSANRHHLIREKIWKARSYSLLFQAHLLLIIRCKRKLYVVGNLLIVGLGSVQIDDNGATHGRSHCKNTSGELVDVESGELKFKLNNKDVVFKVGRSLKQPREIRVMSLIYIVDDSVEQSQCSLGNFGARARCKKSKDPKDQHILTLSIAEQNAQIDNVLSHLYGMQILQVGPVFEELLNDDDLTNDEQARDDSDLELDASEEEDSEIIDVDYAPTDHEE
ncbi:hypothetical protein HAX54_026585 [Datura stramonium]|uniref:Uncharacterized protein n=1 Tax=Datura stramonium TaxID=4076 RepID=A0ABS8V218_DATST|nr:hypothetical protein [Datura stramonium]